MVTLEDLAISTMCLAIFWLALDILYNRAVKRLRQKRKRDKKQYQ